MAPRPATGGCALLAFLVAIVSAERQDENLWQDSRTPIPQARIRRHSLLQPNLTQGHIDIMVVTYNMGNVGLTADAQDERLVGITRAMGINPGWVGTRGSELKPDVILFCEQEAVGESMAKIMYDTALVPHDLYEIPGSSSSVSLRGITGGTLNHQGVSMLTRTGKLATNIGVTKIFRPEVAKKAKLLAEQVGVKEPTTADAGANVYSIQGAARFLHKFAKGAASEAEGKGGEMLRFTMDGYRIAAVCAHLDAKTPEIRNSDAQLLVDAIGRVSAETDMAFVFGDLNFRAGNEILKVDTKEGMSELLQSQEGCQQIFAADLLAKSANPLKRNHFFCNVPGDRGPFYGPTYKLKEEVGCDLQMGTRFPRSPETVESCYGLPVDKGSGKLKMKNGNEHQLGYLDRLCFRGMRVQGPSAGFVYEAAAEDVRGSDHIPVIFQVRVKQL